MTVQISVDWLEFTTFQDGVIALDSDYWTPSHGFRGYQVSEVNEHGVIVLHNASLDRMGVHWILTGSAYRKTLARVDEGELWGMVARHGKATRVDICADFLDRDWLPVLNLYRACNVAKNAQRTIAATIDIDGNITPAQTMYIGSPNSDKRIRVYNKTEESKLSHARTRIELQLRRRHANNALKKLVESEGNMQGIITGATKNRLIGDNAVRVSPDKLAPDENKTKAWLLSACVPALARIISREPDFETTFYRALLDSMENQV